MTDSVLELDGITVRYGALYANRDVTFRLVPGTIHALCGENGAGKSTLMKVAYGEARADSGRLRLFGRDVPIARHSPAGAIAQGIGMVHQHFMLVPTLTVAENVVLGREPVVNRWGRLDLDAARAGVSRVADSVGLVIDPARVVDSLSVGEQQRVEIVKVLWRGAQVLLLDEPTAVLTPREVDELFDVLRRLAKGGKAIVVVTHKLNEVAAIADAVTVMRRGACVAEFPRGADPADVARAMVGRDPEPLPATFGTAGAPVLEVHELRVGRKGAIEQSEPGGPAGLRLVGGRRVSAARSIDALAGVQLTVHAGEIVGVAGVEGNGQSELIEAIAGLVPAAAGTVRLAGQDVTAAGPAARARAGLGVVPEDRQRRGLILDFTVSENLMLGRQREFSRGRLLGQILDRARVERSAAELIARFDIRPPDGAAPAGSLSGGNQQKIVVARELTRPGLRVLLAAQPTRGVDLGASEAIHRELVAARDRKIGVLLVSSDLHELRTLCDRIVVMFRGAIVAELRRDDASEARLGELMATGTAAA